MPCHTQSLLFHHHNVAASFETRIVRVAMSKTTRKTYSPQFKMKVTLEVEKEQETLSLVAAKHGESLSLAASWKDELLAGADDIFGKARTECASKEQAKV